MNRTGGQCIEGGCDSSGLSAGTWTSSFLCIEGAEAMCTERGYGLEGLRLEGSGPLAAGKKEGWA
eukprot:scaffold23028_cov156-Isochrysis_galbana.AAC.1